ncbi:hypothetical protein [Mesorhizobium sp. 2RAF21]|uniref:hypothetical protein n=1 Tax=Mesorhizobium sp. 2RAF21 TaxID=3232995 RepID=UPI003F960779
MDGIIGRGTTSGSTEAYRASGDVELIVTAYHIEQARRQRRRKKARRDAPARAARARSEIDAAIDAANAIEDSDERKAALQAIDDTSRLRKSLAKTARAEREQVRRRMKHGFENPEPTEIGGRVRAPFREKGLRSDHLGRAGKLFVIACRKARFLRSANEKGFITVQSGRKVLNLDYAWVEGNRKMVSLLRVDLDRCFTSFDELRCLLREFVDAGELPCMPHLVAGDIAPLRRSDRGPDGVWRDSTVDLLVRPHLWFILPAAVNMGLKGKAAPKRLFESVYRGLCNVLLPLGADPNAKAMLVRGKNPLSPWWRSENFNDETFPSLSQFAKVLGKRMRIGLDTLSRMAAEEQSGLSKTASNVFFTAAAKEAWRILREWHGRRDKGYQAALGDRNKLRAMLAKAMPMDIVLTLGDGIVEPRNAAYVLNQVVGFAARRWDPAKADAADGHGTRGRDRHLVDGMETKQAQAVAGRVSADAKQCAAREAVMKAMAAVEASGTPFTRAEVARVSGLDRKTVSKHWRSCEARRPNRCVDKKGGLTPTAHEMERDMDGTDQTKSEIGVPNPAGRDHDRAKVRLVTATARSILPMYGRPTPAVPGPIISVPIETLRAFEAAGETGLSAYAAAKAGVVREKIKQGRPVPWFMTAEGTGARTRAEPQRIGHAPLSRARSVAKQW